MRIAILGAGAWGTALALALSARHAVKLWARSAEQRQSLARERRSRYLPDVVLSAGVAVAEDLSAVMRAAELVLVATPTSGLREALNAIVASGSEAPVVWACKGFEQATGRLPHEVAAGLLDARIQRAVLSGPSFALEVARGQPTAITLASDDREFARSMALALHQPRLRVYFSSDVIGVETGGAVKNVMAIATGISDGLGLGLNARAALITRGLAELTRLGVALGGQAETFMGLAGAGDLILTCTGDLSRNRRVGLELAQGKPLDRVLAELGHVAEGVHTAQAVAKVARERGVEMPITTAVCDVLTGRLAPRDAVEQLLARDPKAEDRASGPPRNRAGARPRTRSPRQRSTG